MGSESTQRLFRDRSFDLRQRRHPDSLHSQHSILATDTESDAPECRLAQRAEDLLRHSIRSHRGGTDPGHRNERHELLHARHVDSGPCEMDPARRHPLLVHHRHDAVTDSGILVRHATIWRD